MAGLDKELAEAEAEYSARVASKEARAAVIRAAVLGWYGKAEASASFVARGEKAAYLVSARALKTTVHVDKVWKVLGQVKFLKIATVPVGVLKKAAGKKYALCATSERVGLRSLTQIG